MSSSRRPNRLIDETSPYLRGHAFNPVAWYPWCEEALNRARTENRPILLSIGYAACHWCHVMERESFEDDETAALMNRFFVCIKVDREERPDLDDLYMQATLALNQGHGGWPMTVMLTPDLMPFFAGTYFPPEDRWGRPGFRSILRALGEAWERSPATIIEQARRLRGWLVEGARPAGAAPVSGEAARRAQRQLLIDFDPVHGGFGGAPKFPPTGQIHFAMSCDPLAHDQEFRTLVTRTLDAMAAGGIYDQLAGGFARYATDRAWLVPHFEKMLYDNALLLDTYRQAWQWCGDPAYRRVALETAAWLLDELRLAGGAFASSLDADSEGGEGAFYVWDEGEILEVLGEDRGRRFCRVYGVRPGGTWEGRSILHRPEPLARLAAEFGLDAAALDREIEESRRVLLAHRRRRERPLRDDKVLAGWNGLAIGALARAGWAFGRDELIEAAAAAARFLHRHLGAAPGRLWRSFCRDRAHLRGVLEDYAYLGAGLLDLAEVVRGGEMWMSWCVELAEALCERFVDPDSGAFWSTDRDAPVVLTRRCDGHDGATPSPNAVAARFLARLARHVDRSHWLDVARRALEAHGQGVQRTPVAYLTTLDAQAWIDDPLDIALEGDLEAPAAHDLWAALGARFVPRAILRTRHLPDEAPRVTICARGTCHPPATTVEDLDRRLETLLRRSTD